MRGKKEVLFDYWDRRIPLLVPGETIIPAVMPFPNYVSPEKEVEKSLEAPIGAPPLKELALKAKGEKIVIAHDDPNRPAQPRRLIISTVLKILGEAGIPDEDIYLLSANGNHPKRPEAQFKAYYGDKIYPRFRSPGGNSRIIDHDCNDEKKLEKMGVSDLGDWVEANRLLCEAGLFIYCGQIIPTNWGGYTGTGVVIGLGSTRSISSTHSLEVVNHPESCHGDPRTMLYRKHKQAIMAKIESYTGKRVFYVDAILGEDAEIAQIFSGYSPEINEPTWAAADKLFGADVPQADVFIVGIPRFVAYGETSNPLISLAFAATPPRIWRNRHLLREGGVVIALTACNGQIDEHAHPSYRDVLNLFRGCHSCSDLVKYEEQFYHRDDLNFKYAFGHAYAPLHAFWLLYESQYILDRASKVIFAGVPGAQVHNAPLQLEGTGGPGAVRDLGCVPARSFDDAWKMAESIVGRSPVVVASPNYWTTPFRPFFNVV